MNDYEELVSDLRKNVKIYCLCGEKDAVITTLMKDAADAIEDLQSMVNRAIGFWDSEELAQELRSLNSFMPDVCDPAWQKAHKEMGFLSPLADIYEMMGVYDEEERGDAECREEN